MSDAQKQIAEATATLAKNQKEMADLEATALAHELSAREARTKRTELKKENEGLVVILRHAAVQNTIDLAQQAAQKAKEEAEAHRVESAKLTDELRAKLLEVDETLAKLREKASE